jgi:hypothetical protein
MKAGNAKLVMVAVGLASLFGGKASAGGPERPAALVLHVKDYQRVPAGELAGAQRVVSELYARIGVEIVWTAGSARMAPADGNWHVDVVIMDQQMTDRDAPDATAFGKGSMLIHRATIYFPRILAHAWMTHSNPARVLALVLAHEVGHTLLPEYSHAASGLMRANWEGAVVHVPGFAPAQATAIRATLAHSH